MNIELFVPVISTLAGVIGTLVAVQAHIRGIRKDWKIRLQEEIDRNAKAEVKAYAAERDFNHLRNNQEQLKTSVLELQKELEQVQTQQIEMKIMLNATYTQLQALASKLGDNSTGWMRSSQP